MIQVVGYCRVSTDKEDQANSFEAQQSYFKEYIEKIRIGSYVRFMRMRRSPAPAPASASNLTA